MHLLPVRGGGDGTQDDFVSAYGLELIVPPYVFTPLCDFAEAPINHMLTAPGIMVSGPRPCENSWECGPLRGLAFTHGVVQEA